MTRKALVPDKLESEKDTFEIPGSFKKKLVEVLPKIVEHERALAQLELNYLAQKSQLVEKLNALHKQKNDQLVSALEFGERDLRKPWTLDEAKMTLTSKE